MRRPFGRLVRHFLDRLVRGGDNVSTEFDLGIGPLLGLLAAPGAFQCFLMFDKYSSFLAWFRGRLKDDLLVTSATDKFLFLSVAMAITGIVTVLKWDRILPDSQDYLNLAPLPLRPRTILLANAAAIAVAVAVLAVDVNGVSMALFPMIVGAAAQPGTIATGAFVATHALCVLLASLFAFFAVFGTLGMLTVVLPRELFRACSSWLRGLLVAAFLALLASGFAGTTLIRRFERVPGSGLNWLPTMWFLGLYQSLQNRPTPALGAVAPLAWIGTAAACALTVVSYSLGYRRSFAGVSEGDRKPSEQRVLRVLLAAFDKLAWGMEGFPRAVFAFSIRALLRNEAQRFTVSVALALGWLLALDSLSETRPEALPLAAPLMAVYLLALGVRVAFEIPAAVPANWIFRSVLHAHDHQIAGVARRVMAGFLLPLAWVPAFALFWWQGGLVPAAYEFAYVAGLSFCLIEIFLAGFRKIPFTCVMPGFRENLPVVCLLQVLGFVAFTRGGAGLERWMLAAPPRLLLLPAAMSAGWFWNQSRLKNAREAGELEEGISFESGLRPTVERLNL